MDPLLKQPVLLTNERVSSLSQLIATDSTSTKTKTVTNTLFEKPVFQKAVSEWNLPKLQVDSITVWKIEAADTRSSDQIAYIITFAGSPRLWPITDDSPPGTLLKAINSSVSQDKSQQDIVVPLWFTSPLTYPDFYYTASPSNFACLVGAAQVFSDKLPSIDFDKEGKTKTFEELNRFQTTADPQLKEAYRENLKSYLNALRCSASYSKKFSETRSKTFTPLLTSKEFGGLAQALQLSDQEIQYCKEDGVVGNDFVRPSQFPFLLVTVIVVALLLGIGGMLILTAQRHPQH